MGTAFKPHQLLVPQASNPPKSPDGVNRGSANYISFSQDEASRPTSMADSINGVNFRRLSNAGDFKMEIFNLNGQNGPSGVGKQTSLKSTRRRDTLTAGKSVKNVQSLADQIQHLLDKNENEKEEIKVEEQEPTMCEKLGGMMSTTIDPQSNVYLVWLFVTSCCWLYNLWIVPVRWAFQLDNSKPWIYDNDYFWFTLDYTTDFVYLVDILLFKTRLEFIDKGKKVNVYEQTRDFYFASRQFKVDAFSLLPLDVLYLVFGYKGWPCLLRIVRILRLNAYTEFVVKCEQHLKSPHLFRITKTLMYLIFVIHITACLYFAMSTDFGIGKNPWVYQGEVQIPFLSAYLRCFYWGLKTVTAIGNSDFPITSRELLFSMTNYLVGVFFFAIVIGQLREVLDAATSTRSAFRMQCDATLNYLRARKVPDYMLHKVRMWFDYVWETQNMVDNREALDSLPDNLKAELRMDVNLKILKKVTIFQGLSDMFLNDLVLRLRPIIYIPGDYVCKKGEVGKEMYIVSRGVVQVAGENESGDRTILATLQPGSVFGEVSLLGIRGMSRRTADIISPGFANLFVLNKTDLFELTKEYPAAQKAIKERTREVAKQYGKCASKFREASKLLVGKKPEILTQLLQQKHAEQNNKNKTESGNAAETKVNFLQNLRDQIDKENEKNKNEAVDQTNPSILQGSGLEQGMSSNLVKLPDLHTSSESQNTTVDMSPPSVPRQSRYRQKPVPPPRYKSSMMKLGGAPQSMDENLTRVQAEFESSKEPLCFKHSSSVDCGATLKYKKKRFGICEDDDDTVTGQPAAPPIPPKPKLPQGTSGNPSTPITIRKRSREATIRRETKVTSGSQFSRMSSRECADLLVNTLDHMTLTRMIENVITATSEANPELLMSRETSVDGAPFGSNNALFEAASSFHQSTSNLNRNDFSNFPSLADPDQADMSRRLNNYKSSFQNLHTNNYAVPEERFQQNAAYGRSYGPPNYSDSRSIPNLDGVNIPIDLDSLLDSLVTCWEPPEEDIRNIIRTADSFENNSHVLSPYSSPQLNRSERSLGVNSSVSHNPAAYLPNTKESSRPPAAPSRNRNYTKFNFDS